MGRWRRVLRALRQCIVASNPNGSKRGVSCGWEAALSGKQSPLTVTDVVSLGWRQWDLLRVCCSTPDTRTGFPSSIPGVSEWCVFLFEKKGVKIEPKNNHGPNKLDPGNGLHMHMEAQMVSSTPLSHCYLSSTISHGMPWHVRAPTFVKIQSVSMSNCTCNTEFRPTKQKSHLSEKLE